MDEAEKYKQRLEAIAEKRRLLEEQERARREMENERMRLQQLKRKSLRDQWLMEGPPLSPSSLDAAAPRSPLWGTQAQDFEKRIDKLESETQQLAEDEEKLKEKMEDGQIQTETATLEGTPTEMVQDVVQNGENAAESGEEIMHKSPQLDKSKVILTNGAEENEEDINHNASVDMQPTTNGLIEQTKSGEVVNMINNVDDEEEGTMVIRAECIMITDEGEDAAEEETKEICCTEENATLIQEEAQKTETESVQIEEGFATTDEAGLSESAVIGNGTEGDELEVGTSLELRSPAEEGAVVTSVPVYTETQPCVTTTLQVEVENDNTNQSEGVKVVSKPKGNITVEFQEVPLSEPQDKKSPGEQQPLLSETKSQETQEQPATTSNQAESPNRADQAETPKRKTCQCCSVM